MCLASDHGHAEAEKEQDDEEDEWRVPHKLHLRVERGGALLQGLQEQHFHRHHRGHRGRGVRRRLDMAKCKLHLSQGLLKRFLDSVVVVGRGERGAYETTWDDNHKTPIGLNEDFLN